MWKVRLVMCVVLVNGKLELVVELHFSRFLEL